MSQERSVHDIVLTLFEKHRATPGAPFDEENFIEFLLPPDPKRVRSIRNSFRGLKHFNAFIDAVQLELNVFLSMRDRETNYSLSKFVVRIEELIASKRSSLASLRNAKRHGFGLQVVVLFNMLVVGACVLAVRYWLPLAVVPFVGGLIVNVWFARRYFYHRAYMRRITAQIEGSKANDI
jgi:hypothetical protein